MGSARRRAKEATQSMPTAESCGQGGKTRATHLLASYLKGEGERDSARPAGQQNEADEREVKEKGDYGPPMRMRGPDMVLLRRFMR